MVPFICFTDEKLFTVAPPINTQNDRLYVSTTTLKCNVDANRLLRTRPTFSRSLMVSIAVSKLGCTELFFMESGVKVNSEYYRNGLLMEKMLPAIWGMSSDFFIFQQDSTPQHIEQRTPLRCCDMKHQASLDRNSGQQTHQTSIQLTTGTARAYQTAI